MRQRNEQRKRSCEGKVKHGSYFAALVAARRTGREPDETGEILGTSIGLVPYKCKFCPGWHTGHQPLKNLRGVGSRQ